MTKKTTIITFMTGGLFLWLAATPLPSSGRDLSEEVELGKKIQEIEDKYGRKSKEYEALLHERCIKSGKSKNECDDMIRVRRLYAQ